MFFNISYLSQSNDFIFYLLSTSLLSFIYIVYLKYYKLVFVDKKYTPTLLGLWILINLHFFLMSYVHTIRQIHLSFFQPEKDNQQIVYPFKKGNILMYKEFFKFTLNYIQTYVLYSNYIYIYNFVKKCMLSIFFSVSFLIFNLFFYQITFLKNIAIYFLIFVVLFWLFSGFNFFLKRYKFGKFTTAVQRFWKRTNMCFWLIEGFLFILFFYYYLNSSQEPLYMYDQSSLNQDYIFCLKSFLINNFFLIINVYILYILQLTLTYVVWQQTIYILLVSSALICYNFFLETYQFYYLLTSFFKKNWTFNQDSNLWILETETPRFRTKTLYFFLCLIAKYWHFLFIFVSWFFFLLKSFEVKKVNHTLLALNLQNLLFLFFLNSLCFVQWLKVFFKKFFEKTYYWFYTNYDYNFFYLFVKELLLLVQAIFSVNYSNIQFFLTFKTDVNAFSSQILFLWNTL